MSEILDYYFSSYYDSIEGSDTAIEGGDIKLQCLFLLDLYFPYDKFIPYWELPVTDNIHKEHVQVIKLKIHILLINTMTMHNISNEDEGYYTCRLEYYKYSQEISRYVYVNDTKSNHSAPRIYAPTGDEIEINAGANITLRCAGSRPVTWETPEHDRYQIEHITNLDGFYHTYLHLINLSYFDTGLYRCLENRSHTQFWYEDNEEGAEAGEEEEDGENEAEGKEDVEEGEEDKEAEAQGEKDNEEYGKDEKREGEEEGECEEGKEGEEDNEEEEVGDAEEDEEDDEEDDEEEDEEDGEEPDNSSLTNHPFTLDTKYMFVKDEQNLYVPHEGRLYAYAYTNVTVPCLPTSRDVYVSLSSILYEILDRNTQRWSSRTINPVIYTYDPQKGFTIQMPGGPVGGLATVTCTFVTEIANSTLDIQLYIGGYVEQEPLITGPDEDLLFTGQTLELCCTVFVYHNVSNDVLCWTRPNNFTSSKGTEEINVIKFKAGKILISKLILHDVKHADKGRYFCHLTSNNATTNKFITVYDQFAVRPFIQNLTYDYAYIGQPLVLRCKVAVDHNVGFQMSWTTPNHTEIQNLYLEHILGIRNTAGQIIFKIDNITQENQGNYSCNVFYSTNTRNYTSKNILVKTGEKPRIVTSSFKDQEEIVILLEETMNLICSAKGDPKPVITWMKDSTEVRRLGEHIGFTADNSELTVHYVQRFDAGLYTCIVENPFGQDSRSVIFQVQTVLIRTEYILVIVFMIILCVVISTLLARRTYENKELRKELNEAGFIKFKSGELQHLKPCFKMTEQAALLSYDTKWEIPRNSIELGRNLGSGFFGLVVEATVTNFFDGEPEKTVAVKMLHRNCNITELNSLICELKIMSHLEEHVNLINLLGACTNRIAEGYLLVVLEYCEHGSLSNYLRENRYNFVNLIDPDTELICFPDDENESLQGGVSTLELLRWALQVARGMEFLASKLILHGDLAVRNVLLNENYVVKISDFGLSKTLSSKGYYKKTSQCPLPVKWMAIESIRDKTFSTQSDVWAFGVVLWELFSLGRTPYAELEPDFRFYRKLESGYRLERPAYSTREIYQVMRECWRVRPSRRPTFSCLVQTLHDLLHDPNKRRSAEAESASDVLATGQADHAAAPDWIALDIILDDTTIT